MSEPFLERLSKFTADAGGLNRDALLFAAGRSSARPNRVWKALATMLAASQALSLVLLLPLPRPLPTALNVARDAASDSTASGLPEGPERPPFRGLVLLRDGELESDSEHPAAGGLTLIEAGPPLRAFMRPPDSLLN
jgi:hypothetical protein